MTYRYHAIYRAQVDLREQLMPCVDFIRCRHFRRIARVAFDKYGRADGLSHRAAIAHMPAFATTMVAVPCRSVVGKDALYGDLFRDLKSA